MKAEKALKKQQIVDSTARVKSRNNAAIAKLEDGRFKMVHGEDED